MTATLLLHQARLDTSEFLLSKLDTAIVGARGIDLISFATSAILGIAAVSLAVATVVPTSFLDSIRIFLLLATGLAVIMMFWLVRRLIRNRRGRLTILRKWHVEMFLAEQRVNSLPKQEVRRMIEIIQSLEDTDVSRGAHYDDFDREFMSLLS